MHVVERSGRVRIWPDLDRHAQRLRLAAIAPIQIHAVRIRIELHRNSDIRRSLEHSFDIDRVWLARKKQSAGWVRQNRQVRIVESREDPLVIASRSMLKREWIDPIT